jgi:hypothetical protein
MEDAVDGSLPIGCPHYQATAAQIKACAFPTILIHRDDKTNREHATDFIYVSSNHSCKVDCLLATIGFAAIRCWMLKKKAAEESAWQSYFEDFGICSGQCTS